MCKSYVITYYSKASVLEYHLLICETLSSQESVKKISEYETEKINADGNIDKILVFIPQRLI